MTDSLWVVFVTREGHMVDGLKWATDDPGMVYGLKAFYRSLPPGELVDTELNVHRFRKNTQTPCDRHQYVRVDGGERLELTYSVTTTEVED